ncbi:hypothetical protein CI109_106431 [Kwoniella shandongensis]|uniref:Uncharacterized protein n=1 Tax=Kwoniella shandongensis TaxID=1734106 RepID=A0A5M6C150_9TREE|nr:uncharacterized protein CI109_002614 [Kwoniella shandongensis]KAA5528857.1 hypothetical protein CI109_002614 [Kwoniella shandongensis]
MVISSLLLALPMAVQAASFAGCMSANIPHGSTQGLNIPRIEGNDCVDQCTSHGYDYSFSYYWDADQLHYCHCSSDSELLENKDALLPAYEGERCFEDDATVYHLPTELTFSHCVPSLAITEPTLSHASFDTPGQCFQHCSSTDRAYILPPPVGLKGGKYDCLCQEPGIVEKGVSMFCDTSAYRRFDAWKAISRLVFQNAGNDGGLISSETKIEKPLIVNGVRLLEMM